MNRRKFIGAASGAIVAVGAGGFLLTDRSSLSRTDLKPPQKTGANLLSPDEVEILSLAWLAPSGHNTQPWFVEYVEPYRWIVGNDKSKWLPEVDPTQRETVLSIGAFVQNLELAAGGYGYSCDWSLLAASNQDDRVLEVKLKKAGGLNASDIDKIRSRRTVRSGYDGAILNRSDIDALIGPDDGISHYLPFSEKESRYLNEQTIEANRIQTYRDPAQMELANWMRFSNSEAGKYLDGLTTASMEIGGLSGWIVRNFFDKSSVMKTDFRERGLRKVEEQVAKSDGWLVITSNDESVGTLIETGRRFQRLFLKVREMGIAIHPMTQILEERQTGEVLNRDLGIADKIQFLLRVGYVKDYPEPVSLRRPVEWFVREAPVRQSKA